jgi:hypothetical protein
MSPVDPYDDDAPADEPPAHDPPQDDHEHNASGSADLYFTSLQEFADWFLNAYRRSLHGHQRAWCPQWWRHPEVIMRLEALWRSFEHLRLDAALGASVWWRDHVDPHMAAILDPDGPLKGCNLTDGHSTRPTAPLPHTPAPAGALTTTTPRPPATPTSPPAAPAASPVDRAAGIAIHPQPAAPLAAERLAAIAMLTNEGEHDG